MRNFRSTLSCLAAIGFAVAPIAAYADSACPATNLNPEVWHLAYDQNHVMIVTLDPGLLAQAKTLPTNARTMQDDALLGAACQLITSAHLSDQDGLDAVQSVTAVLTDIATSPYPDQYQQHDAPVDTADPNYQPPPAPGAPVQPASRR